MSFLSVILILLIVGVALWLVNTYAPVPKKIKTIINVVVIVVVVLWLLVFFGIVPDFIK